ncbi:hypothetical protein ZIOFF_011538 [Zingiber officinale]|uniref:Uncharacterized protein n=1 Tax=Zingiber officinale TaxID=94328 RepID=A0A8J5I634_ZINOF|nr:hypothetical protein ZIOFF_011538 [Zingiber officinale]
MSLRQPSDLAEASTKPPQGRSKLADDSMECLPPCGSVNIGTKQEAISTPWRNLPRKMSKLYFALRVIERFELSEGRTPGKLSSSDFPSILKLRKELCDAQSLNESHVPEKLFERILHAGSKLHPPICAILGGILGQEVIKAISGKGDPLKNFFYFDTADGKGLQKVLTNTLTLFSIKQKRWESLREYIQQFNQVSLEVFPVASEVLIGAFSEGLWSFAMRLPRDFDELFDGTMKYINVMEAQKVR